MLSIATYRMKSRRKGGSKRGRDGGGRDGRSEGVRKKYVQQKENEFW